MGAMVRLIVLCTVVIIGLSPLAASELQQSKATVIEPCLPVTVTTVASNGEIVVAQTSGCHCTSTYKTAAGTACSQCSGSCSNGGRCVVYSPTGFDGACGCETNR
jgi:hypothetical protein